MLKILLLLISIPKIIWTNFAYLPFSKAVRFPIMITYNTKLIVRRGGQIIVKGKPCLGMIRIGFHRVPVCNDHDQTAIIVSKGAILEFKGKAHIGNGSKMHVAGNASLFLGDNFAISASSSINCYHHIEFGRDIQFSWNCLVMDSDTHSIYDEHGRIINNDKPIKFGDKIWIGCNCVILKGSIIPSNCVIGANSVVSGQNFTEGTVIAGNPPKCIKKVGGWRL